MRTPLLLLSTADRRLIAKRIRQRKWAAAKRKANPGLNREQCRQWRAKAVPAGYYRKGGKGYSAAKTSAKRRKYFRWYNANVRFQQRTCAGNRGLTEIEIRS